MLSPENPSALTLARVRPAVHEMRARTMLNRVPPPLPFRWSANPYRGCAHGCTFRHPQDSI
jgi:DNA repair photolyase